jgi:hypothetical protein
MECARFGKVLGFSLGIYWYYSLGKMGNCKKYI